MSIFRSSSDCLALDLHNRNRYGHSNTSWPVMWKRVLTEVEGEPFADRVVIQAELREGFAPRIFETKKQTNMLYWSVRIVS